MKQLIFILAILTATFTKAQDAIKKVIVENYYVSDANDATDSTGGHLETGSKTYRIYVQLQQGYKLTAIYGDVNHQLKISSTANFFNNIDRGKTFAKDINKSNYTSNTAALDSWLTLGQTTKNSTKTYFGVLKPQDTDGSFVGGINNDGGSAAIANGLLNNNDILAGIPLTMADGMDTMNTLPTNWFNNGILDILSGADSTIFGSIKAGSQFISNNMILKNSGVTGVNPDSNQILIAQLTTKGEISFELNIEVLSPTGASIKYVAQKASDSLDATFSGWLKYPTSCGCKDPNYFEYNSGAICTDNSACHTRIVCGCTDNNACNYDPNANYNIQSLCCYPGMCADRDISLVCPNLGEEHRSKLKLYPNPAYDQINLEASVMDNTETKLVVYNSYGKIEFEKNMGIISGDISQILNIANLLPGIYLVKMFTDKTVISSTFIKN